MKLICKVDENEDFSIDNVKVINLNNHSDINYTFLKKPKEKEEYFYSNFYSDEGLDLLTLSLFVFAADRRVLRTYFEDSWTRHIELFIPVLAYEKWILLKEKVENMLSFLSGDCWTVNFRKRNYSKEENAAMVRFNKSKKIKKSYNTVTMFSGGLDSFIGSINLLEEQDNLNLLFVSHYGGGKGTKEYQDLLKEKFCENYKVCEGQFCQNYAAINNANENSTRTRSFMFFSHAIAYASCMKGKTQLIIPENGLISLNIPLTFTRLGSSSTRTTHPHYMKMFRDLVKELGINTEIVNPYQFKTKGEMILECRNKKFLEENLGHTMSCSHPDNGRYIGIKEAMHCGNCLPCTIRKASIKKSGLNDSSKYLDKNYSSGKPIVKKNLNVYRLALANYDPKKGFLNIQKSGPIENNINDYASLYNRGMEELKSYLEDL